MVPYEQEHFFKYRIAGPYGWSYWLMMTCNVISPQLFWFKKLRRNIAFTFIMSIVVNIGMWFERFVIIVTSVYRDYLPSSWSIYYRPSIWEIGFYLGTFGLFFTCFFLFAKYFPVIAIAEIKHVLKTTGETYKNDMEGLEKMTDEQFYELTHHDDHHDSTVIVAHH
jgi:molybdopterin-containing oxidoreductase family membrane subunit